MIIDFSKVSAKEMPVLILRNLDGTAIQTLGHAFDLKAELCYNEVSTISFQLPRFVDGIEQPRYEDVIGTRIVDMDGWGQFLLVDPSIQNDGISEIKECKAYSLEYEFTKKKMSLEESTYNFWNPVAPDETVLGIILEYMPSWSVGDVDQNLVGKYRTFSVEHQNIYDFIKNTVQRTYSCIFEFDTYNRKINVKHTDTDALQSAMHISLENLAKKITVTEDTENIFTVLDVNGADGVDIRSVNPLGTNKIYNLDYFMNLSHFSQDMIDKWNSWKAVCESRELEYYNLTIERMLKVSEILTKQNQYDETVAIELAKLKNLQSVKTEYLASLVGSPIYIGLSSTAPDDAATGPSEPSVGNYARVQLKYVREDSEGIITNSEPLVFPKCTGTWFDGQNGELARYWVAFDSITGGKWLDYFNLQRPTAIVTGDTMELGAGEIQITLDLITGDSKEYLKTLGELQDIKRQIEELERELGYMTQDVDALKSELNDITQAMRVINQECAFSNFFTDEELLILDRYFIEDSITDSSFVIPPVKNYVDAGFSVSLNEEDVDFYGGKVTKFLSYQDREIYTVEGGFVEFSTQHIKGELIKAIIEIKSDTSVVITAYLGRGELDDSDFPSGCLSMTARSSQHEDDTVEDPEIRGTFAYGSMVRVGTTNAQVYFTQNTTEYEQYSVEWDLLEYGRECLNRLAWPSYTFSVDSENFFALDEFLSFVQVVGLGKRVYISFEEDKVLTPILTKVELEFDELPYLQLSFGDTYNSSDNAFRLVDLLEQSVSMGKSVDVSRFNYNSFIDSGASTAVKSFMESALDVSKNAVLSSSDINITWDGSGMHFRRTDNNGNYYPEEIAIVNNSIIFTDDGWGTSKMAVGHFKDANTGDAWGVVAPNIVGTLLAGQNLVIESTKKDGNKSVFRVDGDGAVLHNARFEVEDGNRHIVLDPQLGFVIGTYSVIKEVNGVEQVDIDSGNAKFWVDTDGNVYIAGVLSGSAFDPQDKDGNEMMDNNGQFKADYLNLHGLQIRDEKSNEITFEINNKGNVTFGGSIKWHKKHDVSASGRDVDASIEFTTGQDDDQRTDLISVLSTEGITLDSRMDMGMIMDDLWLTGRNANTGEFKLDNYIHVLNPTWDPSQPIGRDNAKYITLRAYILRVVNGT